MTTYTSKNGTIGITDDVSGGYSSESKIPCNAKDRNREFKNVLNDCLTMTKRIVELETCLINMRELLSGQKDKSCLGTGYPANENDCAPWPIIDEAINEITQALKEPKS